MKTKKQIEKRIVYLRGRKTYLKGTKQYSKLEKGTKKLYDDLENDIQVLIWVVK